MGFLSGAGELLGAMYGASGCGIPDRGFPSLLLGNTCSFISPLF